MRPLHVPSFRFYSLDRLAYSLKRRLNGFVPHLPKDSKEFLLCVLFQCNNSSRALSISCNLRANHRLLDTGNCKNV